MKRRRSSVQRYVTPHEHNWGERKACLGEVPASPKTWCILERGHGGPCEYPYKVVEMSPDDVAQLQWKVI